MCLGTSNAISRLHFARRGREKFDVDLDWRTDPKPPQMAGTLCRLDCRVHAVQLGGDHWLIFGEVMSFQRREGVPLIFHKGRFGRFVSDPGPGGAEVWKSLHGEWF